MFGWVCLVDFVGQEGDCCFFDVEGGLVGGFVDFIGVVGDDDGICGCQIVCEFCCDMFVVFGCCLSVDDCDVWCVDQQFWVVLYLECIWVFWVEIVDGSWLVFVFGEDQMGIGVVCMVECVVYVIWFCMRMLLSMGFGECMCCEFVFDCCIGLRD